LQEKERDKERRKRERELGKKGYRFKRWLADSLTIACMILLTSKIAKLLEAESRMVVIRGWGKKRWGDVGQKVQIYLCKISLGILLHSMVSIANNTALYTSALLEEQNYYTQNIDNNNNGFRRKFWEVVDIFISSKMVGDSFMNIYLSLSSSSYIH
jgi:hypothetical protein